MENRTYSVEELMQSSSFRRWTEGTADTEEAQEWDQWANVSEKNREKARKANEYIAGFEIAGSSLPDLQKEWTEVEERIKADNNSDNIQRHIHEKKHKKSNKISWFFRAAAVLLIGIFAGWFIYTGYPAQQQASKQQVTLETITSDFGEKKTLNLSDGSSIILAAGSKLTYNEDWLTRPVKRITLEGEAYFSIAPADNKANPKFVVHTEDGEAAVWGTRFSVNTYGDGTQVVLEEGEVRVRVDGVSSESDKEIIMTPGELANFERSVSDIAIRKVNPRVYTAWASDMLIFDNTPVSHLASRIERTYDVEVMVGSREVMEKKLSGSVNFKDLDSLIRAVSEVLKINISRTDRTVFINETNSNRVNQ